MKRRTLPFLAYFLVYSGIIVFLKCAGSNQVEFCTGYCDQVASGVYISGQHFSAAGNELYGDMKVDSNGNIISVGIFDSAIDLAAVLWLI